MNIECVQEKLKEAVGYAERISSKHATLPVLSCLLFDATQKNQLTIKATNLDLGIEITLPVKTNQEGIVAVPSTTMNSFLVNATGDDKGVTLETVQGNLKVNTTRNSGVIKIQQHEDSQSIPKVPSEYRTYFSVLKELSDTKYYQDVIKECSYFRKY